MKTVGRTNSKTSASPYTRLWETAKPNHPPLSPVLFAKYTVSNSSPSSSISVMTPSCFCSSDLQKWTGRPCFVTKKMIFICWGLDYDIQMYIINQKNAYKKIWCVSKAVLPARIHQKHVTEAWILQNLGSGSANQPATSQLLKRPLLLFLQKHKLDSTNLSPWTP